MAITCKNRHELKKWIESEKARIRDAIIMQLMRLGEECVIEAKDRPMEESWVDHTGNLRSSIGYVIVYDGEIVQTSSFETIKEGTAGSNEGKRLAVSLAEKYKKGFALIVVAGMNYAEKVEALDSKCVLASAELYARDRFPKMMDQLRSRI